MNNEFNLTLEEVQGKILASCPTLLQFKNSLRFIQSSTSLSMDGLISKLDIVGQECFLAGLQEGILIAKKELLNAQPIQSTFGNPDFGFNSNTDNPTDSTWGKKEEKS